MKKDKWIHCGPNPNWILRCTFDGGDVFAKIVEAGNSYKIYKSGNSYRFLKKRTNSKWCTTSDDLKKIEVVRLNCACCNQPLAPTFKPFSGDFFIIKSLKLWHDFVEHGHCEIFDKNTGGQYCDQPEIVSIQISQDEAIMSPTIARWRFMK